MPEKLGTEHEMNMSEYPPTQKTSEPSWEPNAFPDLRMKESIESARRTFADFEPAPEGVIAKAPPRTSIQLLVLLGITISSILAYWVVSRYVITAVVVQGRSMLPTLNDGDRFLLNRCPTYFPLLSVEN